MTGMPEVHRDFARRFPKDSERLRILKMRWPSEFTCPHCGDKELPSITARRYLMCRKCGQTISITAGTLFHGRHLKLSTWDKVIKAVTDHDRPVSASQLFRELNLRRRQTLIPMLTKLRELMRQPDDTMLRGEVQVDTLRLRSSTTAQKGGVDTCIFIAVEVNGLKPGRIAIRLMDDMKPTTLLACVRALVELGSTIHTREPDQAGEYHKLGYNHRLVEPDGAPGADILPACGAVAEQVKRSLSDVYRHGVKRENLSQYLAECAFRANHARRARTGRKMYDDLLLLAVHGGNYDLEAFSV